MTDLELLREALKHSGLPVGRFAREIMGRSPSCVYAWLSEKRKLSSVARQRLIAYLKSS